MNGRLLAVGEGGSILVSTNGTQWQPSNYAGTEWLNDVAFVDETYFVFGTGGLVLTSRDAFRWTAEKATTSKSLYSAAAGAGQIVAVGLEGVILRKQVIPKRASIEVVAFRQSGTNSVFLFGGEPDQTFSVETVPNLGNSWQEIEAVEILDPSGMVLLELAQPAKRLPLFRAKINAE